MATESYGASVKSADVIKVTTLYLKLRKRT